MYRHTTNTKSFNCFKSNGIKCCTIPHLLYMCPHNNKMNVKVSTTSLMGTIILKTEQSRTWLSPFYLINIQQATMVHRKSHLATQWLPFFKLKEGGVHLKCYIQQNILLVFPWALKGFPRCFLSLSSDGRLSPKLKAFVGINKANLPNWNLFRQTQPRVEARTLLPNFPFPRQTKICL